MNSKVDENTLDLLLKKSAADHQPGLPSPQAIWWRAEIIARQKQRERVERPFLFMLWGAAGICMFICLIALTRFGDLILKVLNGHQMAVVLPFIGLILAIAAVAAVLFFFRAPLRIGNRHS